MPACWETLLCGSEIESVTGPETCFGRIDLRYTVDVGCTVTVMVPDQTDLPGSDRDMDFP